MDEWNRRTILLVSAGVMLAAVVASFGFSALSSNPLVPNSDVAIEDAPAPYTLTEQGRVDMVTFHHMEGESVPIEQLQVVVGSRSNGLVFDATNNWTVERSTLTFQTLLNNRSIANRTDDLQFDQGDTLRVAKTSGTTDFSGRLNVSVRLIHPPSSTTVSTRTVTIE
jgi:FlaG/FlaF family flagellin (archaellin)